MNYDELLYNCLTSIFKSGGVGQTPKQMENLREACIKLANTLEKMIKNISIDNINVLQKAINTAFEKYEDEIEKLSKNISDNKGNYK